MSPRRRLDCSWIMVKFSKWVALTFTSCLASKWEWRMRPRPKVSQVLSYVDQEDGRSSEISWRRCNLAGRKVCVLCRREAVKRRREEQKGLENSALKTALELKNLLWTVSFMDSSFLFVCSFQACYVADGSISYFTKTSQWAPGTGRPGFWVWLCHLRLCSLERLRVLISTMEMVTTAISINRFRQRSNRDNAQAQSKTVNKDCVCFFPLNWNQGYILRSDTHGNHGVGQHMLENAKSQSSWLWHFLDTRRGTLEDSSGLAWANSKETDFSPKAIK